MGPGRAWLAKSLLQYHQGWSFVVGRGERVAGNKGTERDREQIKQEEHTTGCEMESASPSLQLP